MLDAVLAVPVILTVRPGNVREAEEGGVDVVDRPGYDHVVVDAHVGAHEKGGVTYAAKDR